MLEIKWMSMLNKYDVLVDGKLFGYIDQQNGFHLDPLTIKGSFSVSAADLVEIALKVKEVQKHGPMPPKCLSCDGTPNFPKEIYNPNEGAVTCGNPIHRQPIIPLKK